MASENRKSWSPLIWTALPAVAGATGLACGPGMMLSRGNAFQPIRLVQSSSGAAAALSGNTTPFSQSTASGNTIIVAVWGYGNTSSISLVSDTAAHTYAEVGCSNETTANSIPVCLYFTTVTSPTSGLTVSAAGTALVDIDISAAEFSGLAAPSLDAVSTGFSDTATTSALTGLTAITKTANELVVAAVSLDVANSPITPTSGFFTLFTDIGTFATGQVVYRIISSTGQQSHSWTYPTPARSASVIATFKGF